MPCYLTQRVSVEFTEAPDKEALIEALTDCYGHSSVNGLAENIIKTGQLNTAARTMAEAEALSLKIKRAYSVAVVKKQAAKWKLDIKQTDEVTFVVKAKAY